MVDAVVTWVNGDDPLLRAKRARYEQDSDDDIAPGVEGDLALELPESDMRFADNNEIWYCIHGIRRFAPFINRIFMVTDAQKPAWLNEELQRSLNIHLVDHRVIFRSYEEFLPTFNSMTIESMLHRIPGISSYFLYFNDDFILINPVAESEYFDRGKMAYRGDWYFRLRLRQRLARLLPLAETLKMKWPGGVGSVGYHNEGEYFKRSMYSLFRLAHAPHPLEKESFAQLFNDHAALAKQLSPKFRNLKQFCPLTLAANKAFLDGRARVGPRDYGYLTCIELTEEQLEKWLIYFEHNPWIKSVCIQLLDQAEAKVETRIKSFLDQRLGLA